MVSWRGDCCDIILSFSILHLLIVLSLIDVISVLSKLENFFMFFSFMKFLSRPMAWLGPSTN